MPDVVYVLSCKRLDNNFLGGYTYRQIGYFLSVEEIRSLSLAENEYVVQTYPLGRVIDPMEVIACETLAELLRDDQLHLPIPQPETPTQLRLVPDLPGKKSVDQLSKELKIVDGKATTPNGGTLNLGEGVAYFGGE